jgi:hypothetical protein
MSKPTGQLRSEMTETSTFREAAQAALVPAVVGREKMMQRSSRNDVEYGGEA